MNVLSNLKIRGKLLTVFGLIVIIFTASSLYTLNNTSTANETSRTMAEKNIPALSAITAFELELVLGHLKLEEGMNNDKSISKDELFSHWRDAQRYAEALLNGGKKDGVRNGANLSRFLNGD
ncbi:MAG: MCP four helix bundle domain-containing protein [Mariprofundaceae bacterium]|nr:MCP four helix bundle domain-containing protein [Mariprofundaceae bacterium]